MWDTIIAELVKYLPQLLVTFFGVFLAFMLDRFIDWRRDRHKKQSLLSHLHTELETIKKNLEEKLGSGNLHFPDIWDSAISSGQMIRLLDSEQVPKLANVYRDVKAGEYEAKRLRDLAEEVKLTKAKGRVPADLNFMWSQNSASQMSLEKNLLEKIIELLKEEWWQT